MDVETTTGAADSTAPATSAPAPTTTTTTTTDVKRPASFGDALRTAAKEGSSPDAGTGASAAAAAATVLPTDAGSPATRGPVPYERFSEINTRMQAAEKRAKEIEAEHAALAWAKGIDRKAVSDTFNWRAQSLADLPGFVRDLIAQAPADRLPQLRSEFARQLATRPAETEPQPDLQTDTGQPVYSARQLAAWQDWRDRKAQTELDKRLAPLQAELNQGRQDRERVQSHAKAQTFAANTMKDAADWPHFTANVKAIAQEFAKQPVGRNETDEQLSLYRAYVAVMKRDVFPAIDSSAETRVLANLKTKALASTEHPGRATASLTPGRPKSLGDALRQEATRAGWR